MKVVEDWRRLSKRNQVIAVAVVASVIVAFSTMIRASTTPQMALLYAGLDASSAGEIIEQLESMDIPTEVSGDAIFVPKNRRDAVRMALAGNGLPRQGQAGFELLDTMNGFATTSDMFDATYWRAKEGELARTILSTPGVRSARVHIAAVKRSAFSRISQAPSAVVTVEMSRGRLGIKQAEAARYIVALAVPELVPEHVAVIDAAGGVILAPGTADKPLFASGEVHDRELALEGSLIDLLEARVGAGNVRVKVTMDVSREQETFFERILDPQQRIITARDAAEIQESGTNGAGAVTVASNLPEGDAVAPPQNQSKRSETTESTKYDVSERRRETTTAPGAVKRLNVAVLVNESGARSDDTADVGARTEEELSALRNLVAAAVGFDANRRDVVTIESLPFEQPQVLGEAAESNPALDFLKSNAMPILQLIIPAIVALILALFVLRPIFSSASRKTNEPTASSLQVGSPHSTDAIALGQTAPPTAIDEMRRIATQNQTASTNVIKNWLEQRDAAA